MGGKSLERTENRRDVELYSNTPTSNIVILKDKRLQIKDILVWKPEKVRPGQG